MDFITIKAPRLKILIDFSRNFDEILFLGEQPNGALFFTGDYLPFSPQNCYLGRDIKPKLSFDMSFVHLRYKREMTETLIKPGHKRVTILRDQGSAERMTGLQLVTHLARFETP